jgi:uridine kinase
VLIDPFRAGEPFALAAFDSATDSTVPLIWQSAPPDALLIVDGVFLHRPELKDLWDHSVWLEVSREVAEARMRLRDGPTDVPERYAAAQRLYLQEANPAAAASVVIDNN